MPPPKGRDNVARKGGKGLVRDQSQVQPSKKSSTKAPLQTKKTSSATADKKTSQTTTFTSDHASDIPIELQQSILDVFGRAFNDLLASDFTSVLQELKGHLYHRDFESAFTRGEYLEPYACRWSPGRALAYTELLQGLSDEILLDRSRDTPHTGQTDEKIAESGIRRALEDGATRHNYRDGKHTIKELKMACLGGGAGAEVIALAGWLHTLLDQSSPGPKPTSGKEPETADKLKLDISVVDIADWSGVLEKLQRELTGSATHLRSSTKAPSTTSVNASPADHDLTDTSSDPNLPLDALSLDPAPSSVSPPSTTSSLPPDNGSFMARNPPLSPSAACNTSMPLLSPSSLSLTFNQHDLLGLPQSILSSLVTPANLITLMFTLNELYTTSLPATTRLLLALGSLCQNDTLLLVVDSPGSYSTVSLGGRPSAPSQKSDSKENASEHSASGTEVSTKTYPMQWLMDHTLLDTGIGRDMRRTREKERGWRWEKVKEEESRWFRLPGGKGLNYQIPLENVRMQVHLYRLVKGTG